MIITGGVNFGGNQATLEWLIRFFNTLSSEDAAGVLQVTSNALELDDLSVDFPETPEVTVTRIFLNGTGLSLSGDGQLPSGSGTLTSILVLATDPSGQQVSTTIELPVAVPIDAILAETTRNASNDGTIEGNPELIRLLLPEGFFFEETGTDSDDKLVGIAADNTNFLIAEGGNDNVIGNDEPDSVSAGEGNDTVATDNGNDTINAGPGNDFVNGGRDDDSIDGDLGGDTLIGGSGNDTLIAGAGGDVVQGGPGDDLIEGGAGADKLDGGGGADTLNGGDRSDRLAGRAGADVLNGGDGIDTADYSASRQAVFVDLRANIVFGGDAEGDIFDSIENARGGRGDDTLRAGDNSTRIRGGGGNDSIDGSSADTRLEGNGGDDTIVGGDGNEILAGGRGNDTLLGGLGDDTLVGGGGRDTFLFVGGDADVIADFDPKRDTLDINLVFSGTREDLANVTELTDDGLLISVGGGTVLLRGITSLDGLEIEF